MVVRWRTTDIHIGGSAVIASARASWLQGNGGSTGSEAGTFIRNYFAAALAPQSTGHLSSECTPPQAAGLCRCFPNRFIGFVYVVNLKISMISGLSQCDTDQKLKIKKIIKNR